MKQGRIFKEWIYSYLVGAGIAGGQVFRNATKGDVKGEYVICDSVEVIYDGTKDGCFPSSLNARLVCVGKGEDATVALADSVEELLRNHYCKPLEAYVTISSRKSDYDSGADEYLEELRIKLDL